MHFNFPVVVLNSTPLLKDLYTLITLNYAAHWKEIGVLLDIPEGRLAAINSDYPSNSVKCCNEMLAIWLKRNTSAKWKDIITAVDSPAVSSKIMKDAPEGTYSCIQAQEVVEKKQKCTGSCNYASG